MTTGRQTPSRPPSAASALRAEEPVSPLRHPRRSRRVARHGLRLRAAADVGEAEIFDDGRSIYGVRKLTMIRWSDT